ILFVFATTAQTFFPVVSWQIFHSVTARILILLMIRKEKWENALGVRPLIHVRAFHINPSGSNKGE
ncbi:MAG: hypothetical protein QF856_03720, partial [Candidatus Marinimicrobia bacterium]|nr:hypothetical protein [Candidatus Neomarinimicrobiota bacterium]